MPLFDKLEQGLDKINSRISGAYYESKASHYLSQQGLSIIDRNFSCRGGELDIIAQENERLVFVEVRYRKNKHYGGAAASVDKKKQAKLQKAAIAYMKSKKLNSEHTYYRFDIIAFEGSENNINWIKNAF